MCVTFVTTFPCTQYADDTHRFGTTLSESTLPLQMHVWPPTSDMMVPPGGASKAAARTELDHLYISVSSFRLPRRPRLRRPLFARSLSRAACSSTVRSVT